MFTINHLIWSLICVAVVAVATVYLQKHRTPLKSLLNAACVLCICSELIKTFSAFKMVPSADGSVMYPYIELQHLPLHLCSLQIILIFYVRFAKESAFREMLLAFMYPTCLIGAALAIAMPSIFPESIDVSQAFTHPLAYQYFLYHAMLVTLGIHIAFSGQVNIRRKHYFTTVGILGVLAFLSLYVNSIFASPTYLNGELASVDYTPNLFFTYEPPLPIALTELWHWYLYLCVILALGFGLIALFYIPFFRKKK